MHVRIVGMAERNDSLCARLAGITPDAKRLHIRWCGAGNGEGADALVRAAARLVHTHRPEGWVRVLGEVAVPGEGWGVVLEDTPGIALAHFAEALPDEVVALLLREGGRLLDALAALVDPVTGEPLGAALRALDPRSVLLAHTGRVTITNLDSVHVGAADAAAVNVYLFACRICEAMVADGTCSDGGPELPEVVRSTSGGFDVSRMAEFGGLRRDPRLLALLAAMLRPAPADRIAPGELAAAAGAWLAGRERALTAWLAQLPGDVPLEQAELQDVWLDVHGFEMAALIAPALSIESGSPDPSNRTVTTPVALRRAEPPRVAARQQQWVIGADVPDAAVEAPTRRARRPPLAAAVTPTERAAQTEPAGRVERPRPRVLQVVFPPAAVPQLAPAATAVTPVMAPAPVMPAPGLAVPRWPAVPRVVFVCAVLIAAALVLGWAALFG